MAKFISTEEQQQRAARRAARKIQVAKIKRFKHRMEITRTFCAVLALIMNMCVLSHIMGFWK